MLPGGPNHPLPETEMEAQGQIITLLFQINSALHHIVTELRTTNTQLQNITNRLH